MSYLALGVLFLIVCGWELAWDILWLAPDDTEEPELEGHPVKFNKTGAIIPIVRIHILFNFIIEDIYNYIKK